MTDEFPAIDASGSRTACAVDVAARTGIDEAMIRRLVHSFYDRVGSDALLAPIFAARIENWEPHLERMCAFWSSATPMTGRYHGQPMQKHAPLPVDARHFDRWIWLFETTAREECPPAAAHHVIERARSLVESLELGVAMQNGRTSATGERFHSETGNDETPTG